MDPLPFISILECDDEQGRWARPDIFIPSSALPPGLHLCVGERVCGMKAAGLPGRDGRPRWRAITARRLETSAEFTFDEEVVCMTASGDALSASGIRITIALYFQWGNLQPGDRVQGVATHYQAGLTALGLYEISRMDDQVSRIQIIG